MKSKVLKIALVLCLFAGGYYAVDVIHAQTVSATPASPGNHYSKEITFGTTSPWTDSDEHGCDTVPRMFIGYMTAPDTNAANVSILNTDGVTFFTMAPGEAMQYISPVNLTTVKVKGTTGDKLRLFGTQ